VARFSPHFARDGRLKERRHNRIVHIFADARPTGSVKVSLTEVESRMPQPLSHDSQALEKYRPYLHLLASLQIDRRLRAKVDASDVVQQTLIQAFAGWEGFRGQTRPKRPPG
jgi:hypothetical protein